MKYSRKYDLQDRLIDFSLLVLEMADHIHPTLTGKHFISQLVRSGTSPALNYAEALGAESRRDFIHKMKLALKELRETDVILRIIEKRPLTENFELIHNVLKENNELISIFVTSIQTAKRNNPG